MSQQPGKKIGFIAPFHAPSRVQSPEENDSDQVIASGHRTPSAEHKGDASCASSAPVVSKTSKKRRPKATADGDGAQARKRAKAAGADGASAAEQSSPVADAPSRERDAAAALSESPLHVTDGAVTEEPAGREPCAASATAEPAGGRPKPATARRKKAKKPGPNPTAAEAAASERAGAQGQVAEAAAPTVEAEGVAGDDGCAPAAEPALPIGSSVADNRTTEDFTPPDAPATCLTSPPAVFKRPNPTPAVTNPEAGAPPVKRRLYKRKSRGSPGPRRPAKSTAGRTQDAASGGRPDQKARILALQARRTCGTWVQCCHIDCGKWRHLAAVQDPAEVPQVWHCTMNDDARYGWCAAPQEHIPNSAFPRLVAVRFTVGSVVWARLDGFPWWPALVDDDPDTEDFFWLDGFSETPTHYHVTFLDADNQPVTRAWVTPNHVKKLEAGDEVTTHGKSRCRGVEYRPRMQAAVRLAREALACPLPERRRRFTFVARYGGPWPVYSDSDAETARLPNGRRPSRKKRRDRRSTKSSCSGAKIPAPVPGESDPRRARSDSSSRSSSRSSSSAGRDRRTVSSLMDTVDDIVQQLTQSQSQSQSRHSQGGAGDSERPLIDSILSSPDSGSDELAVKSPLEPCRTSALRTDRSVSKPKIAPKPNETYGALKPHEKMSKSKTASATKKKSKKASAVESEADGPKLASNSNNSQRQPSEARDTPRQSFERKKKLQKPRDVDTKPDSPKSASKLKRKPQKATTAESGLDTPKPASKPTKKVRKPPVEGDSENAKSSSKPKEPKETTLTGSEVIKPESVARAEGSREPSTAVGETNQSQVPRPKKPKFQAKVARPAPGGPSATAALGGGDGSPPAWSGEWRVPPQDGSDEETSRPGLLHRHRDPLAAAPELELDAAPELELESALRLEPLPAAESSSLFEPAPTPSPRAYTELQSEPGPAGGQSQELFGADGYQSDPFEADD